MRIPDSVKAENCRSYRENGKRLLASAKPEFAILYSYWNLYADPKTPYYFLNESGEKEANQRERFISEFHATVRYLRELGILRILVVGPTPTFPRKAPECVVRSEHYSQNPDVKCSQPRPKADTRREAVVGWIKAATDGQHDVRVVDPIDVFCDSDFCRPFADRNVLFNDTNHISDAGIRAIAQSFPSEIAWVMGNGG